MKRMHSLVVGGTRGLGRALVKAWAGPGHTVSVIGRRASPKVPGVHAVAVDLTDSAALSRAVVSLARGGGRLDHLVFFQRYRGPGDAWKGEIETTLTGTKNLIERCAPLFRRGGGSIVVVGSLAAGLVSDDAGPGYHAAKAGLRQLARYYAVALAPRGIRVNCVTPGAVLKDEARDYYRRRDPRLLELYRRVIPLGRMGAPEDVADAVRFLCGPQASYITGQDLVVDGGMSLRLQASVAGVGRGRRRG